MQIPDPSGIRSRKSSEWTDAGDIGGSGGPIGVPTVVDAATIVSDTMENLIQAMETSETLKGVGEVLKMYNNAEKYELVKELISPHLNGMFVTPKDEDEMVKQISYHIGITEPAFCRQKKIGNKNRKLWRGIGIVERQSG